MKRNGGLIAGLLAVAAFFGVSNLPKTSESTPATGLHQPTSATALAAVSSQLEHYPCEEIADRLQRFVAYKDAAPMDSWKFPDSCYKSDKRPSSATTVVTALDHVGFTIAIVPNPVATHLPLFFDRLVETIQQAAQDENYSYDASWFPWEADHKDYLLFGDQHAAE